MLLEQRVPGRVRVIEAALRDRGARERQCQEEEIPPAHGQVRLRAAPCAGAAPAVGVSSVHGTSSAASSENIGGASSRDTPVATSATAIRLSTSDWPATISITMMKAVSGPCVEA